MAKTRHEVSDRVRVRRGPARGRYDSASIDDILGRGLVAHVAFSDGENPCCVPMLYAHLDGKVYIHGSTASRAMRALAGGAAACVTVTIVHALVLARSAYEHSANYEAVMAFGTFELIDDPAERVASFEAFTERLLPGRWDEVRQPSAKELKATMILAMEIDEASAKVRTGPPDDDDSPDADEDIWAGVVPIVTSFGAPVPSPGLRPGIPVPPSVHELLRDAPTE